MIWITNYNYIIIYTELHQGNPKSLITSQPKKPPKPHRTALELGDVVSQAAVSTPGGDPLVAKVTKKKMLQNHVEHGPALCVSENISRDTFTINRCSMKNI